MRRPIERCILGCIRQQATESAVSILRLFAALTRWKFKIRRSMKILPLLVVRESYLVLSVAAFLDESARSVGTN